MPERAEIEAVARALNSRMPLGWPEGLPEAIIAALDRVRDARGTNPFGGPNFFAVRDARRAGESNEGGNQ